MKFKFGKMAAGMLSGVLAVTSLFGFSATASETPSLCMEAHGSGMISAVNTATSEIYTASANETVSLTLEEGTNLAFTFTANDGNVIDSIMIDGIPQMVEAGAVEYHTSYTVPAMDSTISAVFSEALTASEAIDETVMDDQILEGSVDDTIDFEQDQYDQDDLKDDSVDDAIEQGDEPEPVSEEPESDPEADERKQLAEKLGVLDEVDSDGYLSSEFWLTHDVRLLNLEDWAKLYVSSEALSNGGGAVYSRARARSSVRVARVTDFPNTPMPWGGTMSNGYFDMTNGQVAFCGNGLLAPPQPSTPPTSNPILITNQSIRKSLYYGANGPDNRLTGFTYQQQCVLTNDFLSYANTGKCLSTVTSNGWQWNAGVGQWYHNIQRLPNPPASYKVYKVEFANSSVQGWTGTYVSQPLFYGVIEPDLGNTSLVKKSSVPQIQGSHYTLAGAEYGVYRSQSDANANRNRVGLMTTDKNGNSNTVSGLETGTYFVKEIKAPAGYKLDSTVYSVSVSKDQTSTLTVQDDPMLGELLIHKVDGNNKALKGAEFTLFNNNGSPIWFDRNADGKSQADEIIANGDVVTTVVSDESGNCSVKNISFGSYQIQETKFPDGYIGSKDKMDITVSQAVSVVKVEITNDKTELKTEALAANGTHEQQAAGEVVLKDTVSYKNINVDDEYVVKGILMCKETGEPLKDAAGNEITAETSFKPEFSEGEVIVEFKVDASTLAGISTVVFEDLYRTDGTLIASHRDINDEKQTVTFIDIKTEASSENGSHNQQVGKVTIKDTVSYIGLKPGKEYLMSGKLMNKDTGNVVTDKDGKDVVSDVKFTPEETDGEVVVEFSFDASLLAGTQTVVFEDLIADGITIAIHHDIDDEDQSINFIDIKTTASSMNGTHEQQALGEVVLTDTIAYTGLTPGKSYTASGILMNKETGEPLLDKDGNQISGSARFTAENADGTVDVEFRLNAKDLAGKDVVVFEELLDKRTVIAEHKDIDDEDQTISFIDIKTEALADNGTHVQINKEEVILKDTVIYTGLKPGVEYKLSGTLMNKETGEVMTDSDGKAITAETVFTPESADGETVVEFRFNGVDFEAVETVVFEKLFRNDIEVAVHEDLTDEDQSVSFRSYSVLVNKVDSGTGRNITNNKFEFTSFSDPECKDVIKVVKGDVEIGAATFDKLASGMTVYIKETKAPLGYLLSDEVVKVQVTDEGLFVNDKKVEDNGFLYSIVYKNTLSPVKKVPNTGTGTNAAILMAAMILSAGCLAVSMLRRKH